MGYDPIGCGDMGGSSLDHTASTTEAPQVNKPGYHLKQIKKGVIGHISKIREELDELKDAEEQGCRIMQILELSDLLGSIELYLKRVCPSLDMHDLLKMSEVTNRAFANGRR